jgi:hypothetical protein
MVGPSMSTPTTRNASVRTRRIGIDAALMMLAWAIAMVVMLTTAVRTARADDVEPTRTNRGAYFTVAGGFVKGDEGADSSGWRLGAGYRFFRWLAAEGSYTRLNRYDGYASSTRREGLLLSLLPTVPLGDRAGAYAKVGFMAGDTGNDNTPVLTYGGGLAADVIWGSQLRFEWEHFELDGPDADTFFGVLSWYLP